MKKLFYLFLFTATGLVMSACSHSNGETSGHAIVSSIPVILEKTSAVGEDFETESLQTAYDKAIQTLEKNPDDVKQYMVLAQVFINKGRLTGNYGYYNNAAMQMLNTVLGRDYLSNDQKFEAYMLQSGVLLSMHQFKQALNVADSAYALSEHNAQLFGALVDANVELGNYNTAVSMCDKMMQLRPDIRSYSRVSYLRQINGDNTGAIEAMKMAVESGVPGSESTEWARIILGDLLLMTNDQKDAEICYQNALELRKNYPYAEAGLGRLEKMRGNYDAAITHTENAIRIMSDVSFVNQLGDIYLAKGDEKKANEVYHDVLNLLLQGEKEQNKENVQVKHNANRELAVAYMHVGDFDQAFQYAMKDLHDRPDNIDANELAAWIAYQKGDIATAQVHADQMLKTQTHNPATLYKAALINKADGNTAAYTALLAEAKSINPNLDPLITRAAK